MTWTQIQIADMHAAKPLIRTSQGNGSIKSTMMKCPAEEIILGKGAALNSDSLPPSSLTCLSPFPPLLFRPPFLPLLFLLPFSPLSLSSLPLLYPPALVLLPISSFPLPFFPPSYLTFSLSLFHPLFFPPFPLYFLFIFLSPSHSFFT